jgi:hypothetical protein
MSLNSNRIRLTRNSRLLEVEFEGRFSADDIAAVKAIDGRRWLPERRVWILPDTAGARTALARAFRRRLVTDLPLDPEPAAAPPGRVDARAHAPSPGEVIERLRTTLKAREYSSRTSPPATASPPAAATKPPPPWHSSSARSWAATSWPASPAPTARPGCPWS